MLRCTLFALALGVAGTTALAQTEETPTGGLYDRPVLMLDPGRHTASIRRMDVDASGRRLVTGSDDRTVRVWSVESGDLLLTIRVPRGPGNLGKVNTVAIDPAGELVAVGGWTRWTEDDPEEQIYIYRLPEDIGSVSPGEPVLVRRLTGFSGVAKHLAFSPDGTRLAAGLGGGWGLRVFHRSADWSALDDWYEFAGDIYGLDHDPAGRLAAASTHGQLRLYSPEGEMLAETQIGTGAFGIAFSPDGSKVAVGYLDTAEVQLFDGGTLERLAGPNVDGLDEDLGMVGWSADGETLYAGGQYARYTGARWETPVVLWSRGGWGERREWQAALTTIISIVPLPEGEVLAASMDPWIGRFRADGTLRWSLWPQKMDPRGQRSSLGVSHDGSLVDFGFEEWGERPARFDVAKLELILDPQPDDRTAPPNQSALEIVNWINNYTPSLDGETILLEEYETSRALAIAPGGEAFVLGTDWALRAYDGAGTQLWRKDVPGTAWAANISGDGRLLVAAFDDGTIRWHRMEDGVELLALFPLADGRNWVAWTPEGVYAATPGARGVLRWHVNRGWDRPAESVPVEAIQETHRPSVIRHVLPQLGTPGALAVAELAEIRNAIQRVTRASVAPGARLRVLTVGVSEYGEKAAHLRLHYAADDARDLLTTLETSQTGLYAEVDWQHLANENATRLAILRALDQMRERMSRTEGGDLAVVHFSGHGAVIDGNFYLLQHDVDARDGVGIRTTALPASVLREEVEKLAAHGRVILLIDACRSGATTGAGEGLARDADLLRAQLRAPNVTVLTSSSANEDSVEREDLGNGAFTEAVLEALTTRADRDRNGVISMVEMTDYIADRVPQLTGGDQTPGIDMRFASSVFVAAL